MISILIPVYNTPYDWLLKCHISIMNQTFQKFEIVYVNDGSTSTETLKFFEQIKNNLKCNIVTLEKNVGICKALNIGLNNCKYDYVARMDSDDIMYNSRLWYQYDYMVKNPDVDLVGSGMNYLRFKDNRWIIENNNNYHPSVITKDVILNNTWFINHPTVMFKKNKILSIGGYDESLKGYAEDYDLWTRMFLNDMILHNIKQNLVLYRFSDNTLSMKLSKDNDDFIKRCQQKIIDHFNNKNNEHNEHIIDTETLELEKILNMDISIEKINNIKDMIDEKDLKIGFLIIATNKYIKFVKPLVDSINKYFLNNYKKTIFCFTDQLDYELQNNVVKIYQEHMSWPMPTLKRYEIFYKNKEKYENIDILYYIDADMLINDTIGEEIIPNENGLLAVIHPGYFRDKIQTYERNPLSKAFVNYNHYVYHCGGVQGGYKEKYLEVCKTLMDNINEDMKNGIIAVWHDESHWNCYLINNPNSYKELDSSYCYPESWTLNLPKRIFALDKNHSEIRK